jgi:taurine dioxygenase
MILAYEQLPDAMKQRIEGLRGLHSGERAYSPKMQALQDLLENMNVTNTEEAEIVRAHPLVRVQPETGRRGLFVNPVYTVGIEGMPRDEADALLAELHQHALREPFTCRFRWRKGSLAIWDNRFTQHYALNDYRGKRRRMHRTTAMGEAPVGA